MKSPGWALKVSASAVDGTTPSIQRRWPVHVEKSAGLSGLGLKLTDSVRAPDGSGVLLVTRIKERGALSTWNEAAEAGPQGEILPMWINFPEGDSHPYSRLHSTFVPHSSCRSL